MGEAKRNRAREIDKRSKKKPGLKFIVERSEEDAAKDCKLADSIREQVAKLCASIQSADDRGITVNFSINNQTQNGKFQVAALDISYKPPEPPKL